MEQGPKYYKPFRLTVIYKGKKSYGTFEAVKIILFGHQISKTISRHKKTALYNSGWDVYISVLSADRYVRSTSIESYGVEALYFPHHLTKWQCNRVTYCCKSDETVVETVKVGPALLQIHSLYL